MRPITLIAIVAAGCQLTTGCVFRVHDTVLEDGTHVRSLSIGGNRPYLEYKTSEPEQTEGAGDAREDENE